MNYKKEIKKHRERKDEYMKKSPQSPLTPKQKQNFDGLDYYPVDEKYIFEVELQEYEDQKVINVQTSTGTPRQYRRFGYFEFELDSEKYTLTVYKPLQSDHLFVGFKDKTSGDETYKDGRYIKEKKIEGKKYLLDFNLAYNPFCAYNENWECPIPPTENILDIEIKAGEKKFH